MFGRHKILQDTIGTKDEENQSYDSAILITYFTVICFFGLSILELCLFLGYNFLVSNKESIHLYLINFSMIVSSLEANFQKIKMFRSSFRNERRYSFISMISKRFLHSLLGKLFALLQKDRDVEAVNSKVE